MVERRGGEIIFGLEHGCHDNRSKVIMGVWSVTVTIDESSEIRVVTEQKQSNYVWFDQWS